eukprot:SAG31_NODE_43640_length_266_cov_0.622754_1_plen_88_part_11
MVEVDTAHYLYSIGDSAVHFAHAEASDKVHDTALRFLARQRATRPGASERRMNVRLHVKRDFNAAADALANGDVKRFKTELEFLLGDK